MAVDREIVLAAVQQNWQALEDADPTMKADREIVLAAVQQTWETLRYADPRDAWGRARCHRLLSEACLDRSCHKLVWIAVVISSIVLFTIA